MEWEDSTVNSYKFKEKLVKLIYKDKLEHTPKYFLGMNPSVDLGITFDSDFEAGNLDFVI